MLGQHNKRTPQQISQITYRGRFETKKDSCWEARPRESFNDQNLPFFPPECLAPATSPANARSSNGPQRAPRRRFSRPPTPRQAHLATALRATSAFLLARTLLSPTSRRCQCLQISDSSWPTQVSIRSLASLPDAPVRSAPRSGLARTSPAMFAVIQTLLVDA